MTIEIGYNFGDKVYLKTDEEQKPRVIIKIELSPNALVYCLANSTQTTWHYECEFSKEKNELVKLGIE